MSNGLKDKIESFIHGIKSKLRKKGDDDDEDYEYEDEDESEESDEFAEKTEEIDGSAIISSEEDEDSDDEDYDDEDEEDDEKKAAKKKQLLIRGFIVLIIAFLAYDTLLAPKEEEIVQVPEVKRPKRKRARVNRKKTPVVKEKVDKAAESKSNTAPTVEKSPVAQDPPVVKEEQVPAPSGEEKAPVVANEESTSANEQPEVVAPDDTNNQMNENNQEDQTESKETIVENSLQLNNSTEESAEVSLGENNSAAEKSESSLDKTLDNLSENAPKMIEKVPEKEIEYQEPPSYQNTGRGLVYNCLGKHWACVDQTSYLNCKKNSDWSLANDKSPECFPSDIYQNFKDCRTIQIDRINTLSDTSFCK
ncbi:hypothetical protein [Halobacteriovorax sp. HLS]|uniref:hypothetical protein n=1 Tax=Halobacteriovorax sp. HLS TaxID=2234000 RepID=UPI0013E36B30|nr:hypothetical protein [Halobacteriovorax sp. HLS]